MRYFPLPLIQDVPPRTAALLEGRQELVQDAQWLAQTTRAFAIDWSLRLVGALVVLILTWFIANWARRTINRALNRPRLDQTFGRFLGNLARWAVIVIGLVACLGVFGVNTTSLAAMVGAAGLAIGLALQGSLSNLAAGIMLLVLRPFKVGDSIRVGGVEGTVYEIELFNLKLNAPDFRRIIVPNSQVFGGVIENFSHNARRRADVTAIVDHAADIARTREVLLGAAAGVGDTLEELPAEVYLNDIAASGANWRVSIWCTNADMGSVRQRLLERVRSDLIAADLPLAKPQMDIRIRPELGGEEETDESQT